MMPHAIRRVYVARRARTAASLSIVMFGIALLAIAAKPAWTAFLAKGLPGINPAVLCTMIVAMWLVGLFAYFAARAVDEHRFAVSMSKLVMPGADVNADLERLSHENPDQAARDMAHRLEVRSAALPVLAAGVLLPVTALYVAAIFRTGGWPVIAAFETEVAVNAKKLIACGGIAAVIAVVMTKRAARLPAVAPTTMVLALAGVGVAALTSVWLVPLALIVATVGVVVRRLRIERDLLQAEDPAAGSEIFTIRGFIQQLRTSAAAVIARVKQVRARRVIIGAMVPAAMLGGLILMMQHKSKHTPLPQTAAIGMKSHAAPIASVGPSGAKTIVETMGAGRLKITLDLVDDCVVDLPALAGLSSVPAMWNAAVKIEQFEGIALEVSPFGAEALQAVSIGTPLSISRANCGSFAEPLGLRIKGQAGHYVLYVEPVLTPAGC